jgi:chromate transport protein ChrA
MLKVESSGRDMTISTTIPSGRISELMSYFLRLGFLGFGGPVALVGQMERELVDERKWLTNEQMREAIAICQSLPGPLAIQVGIYVSYLRGGFWGAYAAAIGTILGACFLLGRIAIGDWLTALIGLESLAILFRWKVNNPFLTATTAVVGLIAFPLLRPPG